MLFRSQKVDVIAIQGNHLIVRVATTTADSGTGDFDSTVDPKEDDRLDFDVAEE